MAGLEDDDVPAVRQVFDWHPLPAVPYQVGPFRLDSRPLPHYVPNAGVRLTAPGLTISYSGDTGPAAALTELGRAADIYLVEATSRDQQRPAQPEPAEPRMHLTAREAGAVAAAAGVQRLLLTHFWPGNDRERSRAEAAEAFGGEILIAHEDLQVRL